MITWHPSFGLSVYVDDYLATTSIISSIRNTPSAIASRKLLIGKDVDVQKTFGNITIDEFQMWDIVVKNGSNNLTGQYDID